MFYKPKGNSARGVYSILFPVKTGLVIKHTILKDYFLSNPVILRRGATELIALISGNYPFLRAYCNNIFDVLWFSLANEIMHPDSFKRVAFLKYKNLISRLLRRRFIGILS